MASTVDSPTPPAGTLLGGLWLRREEPGLARRILAACEERSVGPGETIFGPHTPPRGLVGLERGAIRLEIVSGPQDPPLFANVTPGFVLSDIPIPDGLDRPVTALADRSCCLRIASPARLRALAAIEPGLDAALARLLTLNLWMTLQLLAMLRRQDPVQRVAALLVILAGADLADGLGLAVTQADLASMAAIGRTTLSAALRELEQQGLVTPGYRLVRIVHAEGLLARRDEESPAERAPVPGWPPRSGRRDR